MAVRSPVTAAELLRVLRAHGLQQPAQSLPTEGVTARVLRVRTAEGPVAIKVFPPDQRAPAEVEGAMLDHLQGKAAGHYRVQSLVAPQDGPFPFRLDDRRVLVTRWAPGEHRPYHAIDPPGWNALGRCLAALHRDLDDHPGHPLMPDLLAGLRALDPDRERATLRAHHERATASSTPGHEAVAEFCAERLRLFDQRVPRCLASIPGGTPPPIHNDYNVHNYLLSPNEPPLILDWERAGRAPRELEFCRCLAHLPIVAPGSAHAFVDGYLGVRSLDPQALAWAADAAASAHALKHWPVQLWLDRAAGATARIEAMLEIPRALVRRAETFDAFYRRLGERLGQLRS